MLHWRLILGVLFVAGFLSLAWLDYHGGRPGLWLAPLALVGSIMAGAELVRLFESNAELYDTGSNDSPLSPSRYVVSTGAAITVAMSFAPSLWDTYPSDCPVGRAGWTGIGLMLSVLMAIVVELIRYQQPGVSTIRLAQAVLGIAYAGGMMGFVVQLRVLGGGEWGDAGRWGLVALLSLIAVVKLNDTGAYTVGRLIGRHKMTPILSPGKTWEGVAGGMLFSIIGGYFFLGPIARQWNCFTEQTPTEWWWGVVLYSVTVGAAGIAGDLAISLLKRDASLKNSSTWLPGFGGVLDLLDSILFAAPIAYLFWVAGIVGP